MIGVVFVYIIYKDCLEISILTYKVFSKYNRFFVYELIKIV